MAWHGMASLNGVEPVQSGMLCDVLASRSSFAMSAYPLMLTMLRAYYVESSAVVEIPLATPDVLHCGSLVQAGKRVYKVDYGTVLTSVSVMIWFIGCLAVVAQMSHG